VTAPFLSFYNPILYVMFTLTIVVSLLYFIYKYVMVPQQLRFKKRLEKDYKENAIRLHKSIEEERKRIAINLHDSVGQNLLFIKMKLSNESSKTIVNISRLVDVTIAESRSIIYALKPRALEAMGLPAAIDSLCIQLQDTKTFTVKSSINAFISFNDDQKDLLVFRIAQEAINNIIKHSCAKNVFIRLDEIDGKILFLISDDGEGFDPDSTSYGIGLSSLIGRSKLFDSSLRIESAIGQGTTIILEVPYGATNNKTYKTATC